MAMFAGLCSCSPNDEPMEQLSPNPIPNPDPIPSPPAKSNQVEITVGSNTFTLTLQDNATANAFNQMLPISINMSELNNNEKYYGLSTPLPTNASHTGNIQNGDLMLYGSNTLVLFYKTFATSYSYTRIGRIDNPSGLESALGPGSVIVSFEMIVHNAE